MLRVLVLLMTVATLAGCATSIKLSSLPKVEDSSTACDVYIVRKSSLLGAGLRYKTALDQQDFMSIASGHYTNIKVDCGSHIITVKYPRQMFAGTAEAPLEFECTPNKKIYILMWPAVEVGLAVLSEEEGEKLVQESKHFDMGKN